MSDSMSDTVAFAPNIPGPVQFQGRGSVIVNPDLQPIFWGPYWPNSAGPVSVSSIMDAIRTVVGSPYLDKLKQYGFGGPVKVRDPIVDAGVPSINLPVPPVGPNQALAVSSAVTTYIKGLVNDDSIDNVDDNHELMTVVFLDPSIPVPAPFTGANTYINDWNLFDDATRFEILWVSCAQSLSQITQSFTHELVEGIADPFNNGWFQTTPPPAPNQGQIGDICNQPALVNGVSVVAYFSQAEGQCLVPLAGNRSILSLTHTLDVHEPHAGPRMQAYLDLGRPLCAAGVFEYSEVTYRNAVTVRMKIQGYEKPVIEWKIDGTAVSILGGIIEVPATWQQGPARHHPGSHGRKNTASLGTYKPSNQATEIKLFVGPNEGNTSFRLDVSVYEFFDPPASGSAQNTLRRRLIEFDLVNQEIEWSDGYKVAKKNCDRLQHLSAGPGVVIGPPQPGDPSGLLHLVTRALHNQTSERAALLQQAADAMLNTRPILARALADLANRSKQPA